MNRSDLRDVTYLGDGAYMGHDGFQVWVFTSDGMYDDNFVALEPAAVEKLYQYMKAFEETEDKT